MKNKKPLKIIADDFYVLMENCRNCIPCRPSKEKYKKAEEITGVKLEIYACISKDNKNKEIDPVCCEDNCPLIYR